MSECAGEDCTDTSHKTEQEPVDAAKAMAAALDAQDKADAEATKGLPKTEVTSIAKEERQTGQKIPTPSTEELVARAGSSLISNLAYISNLIEAKRGGSYVISRKGMNRLLISILDLPTDGIPVLLNSKEEKLGFGVGQRVIADRFILTQHHINEQIKELRAEAAHKAQIAAEEAAKSATPQTNELTKTEETSNIEPTQSQGDLK